MKKASLEERVTALEQQLANLTAASASDAEPAWRRAFGMFAGDETMKRILDAALAYREADRRRTKPKRSSPKSGKK